MGKVCYRKIGINFLYGGFYTFYYKNFASTPKYFYFIWGSLKGDEFAFHEESYIG